jgi:hypothetical protein
MPKAPVGLYNHSQRQVVSHQVASSSGSTTSGRRHVTFSTTAISVPIVAPDPGDRDDEVDMDVDFPPEHIDDLSSGHQEIEEIPGVKVVAKARAKRYANSVRSLLFQFYWYAFARQCQQDVPLDTWKKYRDEYLDECMVLEGRGKFFHTCAGCKQASPQYRCRDCMHGALWCKDCIVVRHDQSPLHRIEVSTPIILPGVCINVCHSRCGTHTFFRSLPYVT